MNLDLNLINRIGRQEFDLDLKLNEELFEETEIIRLNNVHFIGEAKVNFVEELEFIGELSGEMILPCSITLEEVSYPFNVEIEENIGNFEEIMKKNKNLLDIIPLICENIVLEIPMKVVKEGVSVKPISGNGWELSEN